MRLGLAKKDYIRVQILSKKISIRVFQDDAFSDLKLKYYRQLIEVGAHDRAYLDICKYQHEIFNTKSIQEDKSAALTALRDVVIYVVLAPFNNEQSDLVARVSGEELLDEIPLFKGLLTAFITTEITPWQTADLKYVYS